MDHETLTSLRSQIAGLQSVRETGRVSTVQGVLIHVQGLSHSARIGDQVVIYRRNGNRLSGEVLQLGETSVAILPEASPDGVAIGDRVALFDQITIAPSRSWIGRIVDPTGQPLDGKPLLQGRTPRNLNAPPPPAAARRGLGERLETGYRAFNTFLPIARGQRIGLFAGSGVGKSSLMGGLAQTLSADIVVIALIGERGRELNEFVTKVLGPSGLSRSVVIAATSDQSALLRRRCLETATTVAEHFRNEGAHVLLLADSVTRFAEAHREIAAAAGELPALRGFPPSTAHRIMSLSERAGPGAVDQGDITAVFSVLVAGSDMEEPIADILRGVLDGHVVLDRKIAERGRFPAVDLLKSVSRSLPDAASPSENDLLIAGRRMISKFEEAELMVRSGIYVDGSDPELDTAIKGWPELDSFISEKETQDTSNSFARLELIFRRINQSRGLRPGNVPPNPANRDGEAPMRQVARIETKS